MKLTEPQRRELQYFASLANGESIVRSGRLINVCHRLERKGALVQTAHDVMINYERYTFRITKAGRAALAVALVLLTCLCGASHAADGPDEVTRQLGLEMLRERMIEQRAEHERAINWQPPGYFLSGRTVRAG